MVDQGLANNYRGTIIDLATLIESKIDEFFLKHFFEEDDGVRMAQFMDLFLNVLTFGHKVDKFNMMIKAYMEFDEDRCKHVRTNLVEFKQLRNEIAHRNGYITDEGKFFLFAYAREDIELSKVEIEKNIEHWTVFAYEVESFASNFLHWIFGSE